MKNKVLILGLSVLFIVFVILYLFNLTEHPLKTTQLTINTIPMTIEQALTPSEQQKGLSGRKFLAPNQGMLFNFPKEQLLYFWMINMKFPIDIIWLDKDCRILGAAQNQIPCLDQQHCPIIPSNKPAKYALEVVSGFVAQNNLSINQALMVCH